MIRSMTGFGEAAAELPQGHLRATIKTVNHRFFNAHLRTPPGFDRFEAEIQTRLKSCFSRGHVNLTLILDRGGNRGNEPLPELDLERARHMLQLLDRLGEEIGVPGRVDLPLLLRFGAVFRTPESEETEEEVDAAVLLAVVEEAARGALAMREQEGERLQRDLMDRLEAMKAGLGIIEERAPLRLESEAERLRSAIRELSQQEDVDQDRLAREMAYLAERWDINEEVVRFKAHLAAFRDAMDENGGEAVGKRLGFLVQEMHREANTIASKANDLEIAHASVSVREEIERLREQLENVE